MDGGEGAFEEEALGVFSGFEGEYGVRPVPGTTVIQTVCSAHPTHCDGVNLIVVREYY